ncbi:unnamed protein product [Cylicostephanus goldi]|uniref:Uncharacterized protein n=1 Tax=Cylicostephanus goldi TaxID=71465 RepID=A0A3P6TA18_CYLGO|nr:unnamed protein product [Cylicostephanus goldi]
MENVAPDLCRRWVQHAIRQEDAAREKIRIDSGGDDSEDDMNIVPQLASDEESSWEDSDLELDDLDLEDFEEM